MMDKNVSYESFEEFSKAIQIETNRILKALDSNSVVAYAKEYRDFKNSVYKIHSYLKNLEIIRDLIIKINAIPIITQQVAKEHKDVNKMLKDIQSLENMLLSEYDVLREALFAELNLSNKLLRDLIFNSEIQSNVEMRKHVDFVAHNYTLLVKNSQKVKQNSRILGDKEELSNPRLSMEHYGEEKRIDEEFDLKDSQLEEFERELTTLKTMLSHEDDSALRKTVTKNVKSIKRTVTPRVISTTKDVLTKLRSSTQLLEDLEAISALFAFKENVYHLQASSDKKVQERYQQISQKLSEIRSLLFSSLEKEEKENKELAASYERNAEQIVYGTAALGTYSDVIASNNDLANAQQEIEMGTHRLQAENGKLNFESGKIAATLEDRTTNLHPSERSAYVEDFNDFGDRLVRNNETLNEIMVQKPTEIPQAYLDVKRKLAEKSYIQYIHQTKSGLYEIDQVAVEEESAKSQGGKR